MELNSESEKSINRAFDPDTFRQQGHHIVDLLADALEKTRRGEIPVRSPQTPREAYEFWKENLDGGQPLENLIGKVLETTFRTHHPNNLGHQVGPVLPVAALAELAGSLLDTGNGVFEVGNPATPMERVVLQELALKIGFPETSDGILTSGGSLGNLTALLAMRQCQTGSWDIGMAEKFTILVSEEAHYCVERAIKIMGWGNAGLTRVPVDHEFRMSTAALRHSFEKAQTEGFTVLGVVGCAGSTATGKIDPLEEIADFCGQNRLWFHVDAAHAGAFVFSQTAKVLLKGIERADSVVIDFHKMLLSPGLLTAVLFRREDDSYQSFAQKADYLWRQDQTHEWWDSAKRTLECTRPMLGLRAYAVLQAGRDGLFASYIDHALEMTRHFASLLRQAGDFELLTEPESNIICYRYSPAGRSDEDLNMINSGIRQKIVESGDFYIVQIEKRGRIFLRSALMNPFVNHSVLESLIDRIRIEGT